MIEELLKNTKNMKSTKLQIEKTLKDANDLANQATEFVTNATEEYQVRRTRTRSAPSLFANTR